jgi:hypothetical protein
VRFAERKVGRQPDGGFLVAFGDDLEQQLGAAGVEPDVAEFVEQQQVEAAVAGHDAGQLPTVGGFGELVDELRGGGVADAAALLTGGQPQTDEQVRLARAGVTEQHDPLPGFDPRGGGEGGEVGGDAGVWSGLKSARHLKRGKRASPMRRARRRLALSSVSAARISAPSRHPMRFSCQVAGATFRQAAAGSVAGGGKAVCSS